MKKNYFLNNNIFSLDKILMTSILSIPFTIVILFDFGQFKVLEGPPRSKYLISLHENTPINIKKETSKCKKYIKT